MRLKTYTAGTVVEAMDLVREEMGEDAIIVSTQSGTNGRGVRITAVQEFAEPELTDAPSTHQDGPVRADGGEDIRQLLRSHGVRSPLVERLGAAAEAADDGSSILDILKDALASVFTFSPLDGAETARPVFLVEPPGCGKTLTVAKLLARSILSRQSVRAVTADTRRAGGVEQLAAFTRILDIELIAADDLEAMRRAVRFEGSACRVYIDGPGINPYSEPEMSELSAMVRAAGAEPVLVLAAGADALEVAEIASRFATVGVRRLVTTRLDMARRLGSLLAAADAGRLAFAEASVNPQVVEGLYPMDCGVLASLLLPDDDVFLASSPSTEAVS